MANTWNPPICSTTKHLPNQKTRHLRSQVEGKCKIKFTCELLPHSATIALHTRKHIQWDLTSPQLWQHDLSEIDNGERLRDNGRKLTHVLWRFSATFECPIYRAVGLMQLLALLRRLLCGSCDLHVRSLWRAYCCLRDNLYKGLSNKKWCGFGKSNGR